MGDDPKSSVTNSYGQTHDVKNLFIADGSIFVSAANQNPTWTILALAMRGSQYWSSSSGPALSRPEAPTPCGSCPR